MRKSKNALCYDAKRKNLHIAKVYEIVVKRI
jgi:hypothetical protein